MSPIIDFSDVKGLDPIPAGWYDFEVVKATEGTSKNGNPKIDLQYKVIGGEFDGRIVFENLTFTQNSLFRVKNALVGMGYDAKFSGEVNADDLVGCTFQGQVVIDVSNQTNDETGEPYPPRNRISKYKQAETSLDDLIGA